MTDLDCGNCGELADELLNIDWFDGYTEAEVTVGCSNCGAETGYSFLEPEQVTVVEYD